MTEGGEPRYAVGIDLGTTNSVIAAVDLSQSEDEQVLPKVLPVAQLSQPGVVAERAQLPSFIYLPHPDELAAGDLTLPWSIGQSGDKIVGALARELGSRTPLRLVASAKSWLSHPGIDRRAALLPLEAEREDIEQLSPLQASTAYLSHLRAAWDQAHPEAPLASLPLTLTVPASFDPAARELTVEAARAAGLENLVLLEEPQAALYSWVQESAGSWREQVEVGDLILVVDVGGGTTDLSLIAVTEDDGALQLQRVAVGDHILLGGDNMDLALASVVRQKLASDGKQLDLWQLQALAHGCRAAKEALLDDTKAELDVVPVVVPSRGSKLIGGTLKSELSRDDVTRTLVEGFFPAVSADARPQSRARGALTRLGLPYAQDVAVTRHLAAFLARQRGAIADLQNDAVGGGDVASAGFAPPPPGATLLHPTALLCNGGALKPGLLSGRLLEVLNSWLQAEGAPLARRLDGADFDLAVARGGAYYGCVRRGRGVRIRGGTAKSYYVGVESALPAIPGLEPPLLAMCVAPFGLEEGSDAGLPPEEFGLVVGEPVRFRFFSSSTRRDDQVGTVLESWADDELEELDEIGVTLASDHYQPGDVVPVRLQAAVTEVGTLRLAAVARDSGRSWDVELDTRGEG